MGEVVTQTVSFEKWTLTTAEDMFTCLHELADQAFRGHVHVWTESDETVWELEFNVDPNIKISGRVGTVVVLMGGVLESMTAEQFSARFTSG